MCGISGVFDRDTEQALRTVARLNELQRHRGPDSAVAISVGSFALGNTRLAIQDPSQAGNQPFTSRDGRYTAVFNGEIYNYKELIREFRLRLSTRCDGAVIPELWSRLGKQALRRLRGMYTIAVVDKHTDTLTIARDPFGIKPLYLRYLPNGTFAFASEVRSLLRLQARPSISPSALADFFYLGAVAAEKAPFASITALAPNQWLCLDPRDHDPLNNAAQGLVIEDDHPLTSDTPEGTLAEVFRESVDLHLRSDVPSALLLSSGVDSSAIACAARSLGHQLHCFTVRIGGSDDESEAAAKLARRYGHHHTTVESDLSADDVGSFVQAMQRPTIDGLNTFLVSKAISVQGYRVALSGLGADEALGGYAHMRLAPLIHGLRLLDRIPCANRALLAVVPESGGSGKLPDLLRRDGPRDAMSYDALQRQLFPPEIAARLVGATPSADTVMLETLRRRDLTEAEIGHYLQPMLLADADSFSMHWSLELRVPFVDVRFYGSAIRCGSFARRKRALARSLHDKSLIDIARQPKLGFTLPMPQWMSNGPLRPLSDAIEDPGARIWDYVDQVEARRVMAAAAPARWSERWSFAVLNAWMESVSNPSIQTRSAPSPRLIVGPTRSAAVATEVLAQGPKYQSQETTGLPAILALLPSQGLGGGIEAYADAVLETAEAVGATVITHALRRSPDDHDVLWLPKLRFTVHVLRSARRLSASSSESQLLCFHAGLLPAAFITATLLHRRRIRIRVIYYGADIWGASVVRRAFWRTAHAERITISSFSAGGLAALGPTVVLPPGIPRHRYERLLSMKRTTYREPSSPLNVLSVFRLADFEPKGGRVLIAAVERLRMGGVDIRLTIAGSQDPESRTESELGPRREWLALAPSPSDGELASLYAAADVFVLASRLRAGSKASGEGFGIVLVEAALAALPVIAPASGGSDAAFIDGVTGLSPFDQSIESLEETLRWASDHPSDLVQMGANGRTWAGETFSPDRYRARVSQVLFGTYPGHAEGSSLIVSRSDVIAQSRPAPGT